MPESTQKSPAFYFTCGTSHRHELGGGLQWNYKNVIQVFAENEDAAREFVFDKFGNQWSHGYDDLDSMGLEYFPGGIVKAFNLTENE